MIHMLRTQYGSISLAVELQHVQSILTIQEAQGLRVLALTKWLGDEADVTRGHIGLISQPSGEYIGIHLGIMKGIDLIETTILRRIPAWVYSVMPPIFHPACLDEEDITWILDLPKIIKTINNTPII